jgi:hypothetical protein
MNAHLQRLKCHNDLAMRLVAIGFRYTNAPTKLLDRSGKMLEWERFRDEVTCEVYHKLWDHNLSKYVIQINEVDKTYKVQILNHVPFHVKRLNVAKTAGQHIYEQIGVLK